MKTNMYKFQEDLAKQIVNPDSNMRQHITIGCGKAYIILRAAELIAPKQMLIICNSATEAINFESLAKKNEITNIKIIVVS